SREAMLKGGDSGPAVVPGKSDESLLIQAIRHEGDLAMPPKKPKLSDEVIASFVKWVDRGAPGVPEGKGVAGVVTAAARRHWAFQSVKKVATPAVAKTDWIRNEIDAFVLAKLEERGWQPASETSRSEWLRRVAFDLVGLPPLPEEIADFE